MSYRKYTWQTGEVITAAKLNNMEDGIDDKLIVNMLDTATGELDVSYADLLAAWTAKKQVLLFREITTPSEIVLHEALVLVSLFINNGSYTAAFGSINFMNGNFSGIFFKASTDSGHLLYDQI